MLNFLFIDATVENTDILQACVNPETIIHRIGNHVDGIEYITKKLIAAQNTAKNERKASGITLSIVPRGISGGLSLGNAVLNLATLDRYSDRIKQWFSGNPLDLHHDRLQIYSHDVVANADGYELINHLHEMTYAIVYAASPDPSRDQQWVNWQFDTIVNTWNGRLAPLFGDSTPAPESPFNTQNLAANSQILAAPIGEFRQRRVLSWCSIKCDRTLYAVAPEQAP